MKTISRYKKCCKCCEWCDENIKLRKQIKEVQEINYLTKQILEEIKFNLNSSIDYFNYLESSNCDNIEFSNVKLFASVDHIIKTSIDPIIKRIDFFKIKMESDS